MPLYEITAPDGSVYEIEGPAGASQQSLIAAVQRHAREQESAAIQKRWADFQNAPAPTPKTTVGGNVKEFFKGIIPGAADLAETAGTGIAALLPDETEKSARAALKDIATGVKSKFAPERGYEESVGRKLGEGLGSTLPFFAAAPFGVPGMLAGAATGVAAGAGEARQNAEAKGATGDERAMATALGIGPGLLDVVAPELHIAGNIIKRALIKGGMEGATEAAQKVSQNLIAKGVYDPKQEILAGSGEEGAYGAGVGALASLLIDMTLGRKAHARTKTGEEKPAPEAETKPEGTQLLGYETQPFTPVAMPDGSVATTRAEYEQYMANKGQREQDKRTSDPLASLPADQQQLARRGKQAALEEAFAGAQEPGQMEIPGIERADGTVEVPGRGRVNPEVATQEEATAPAAPEVDPRQRDMINESEDAQLREMEAQQQAQQSKATAEQARLKFESDLETLDNSIEAKRKKTTEDTRLQILLPIVASPVIENIEPAFVAELKRQGITNTKLSEREQAIINRALDIKAAEVEPAPAVEEGAPAPAAPAENQAMEALIPERSTAPVEPSQPSLPGMGKPKGVAPQAFSESEQQQADAQFATVLTPEVLTRAGLPKQSGFFKQLVGKDMADPAQQPEVAAVLARVRTNPNVSAQTKEAIENIAMQAFGGLATQQDMFANAPNKATTKPAGVKPSEPSNVSTTTIPAGTGVSSGDGGVRATAGQPVRTDSNTRATEAPKPTGLADHGKPTADTGGGKGKQPGALTAADMLARAEEAQRKADAAAKTEESKPAKTQEKKSTEEAPVDGYILAAKGNKDTAIRSLAADAFLAIYPEKSIAKKINEIMLMLTQGKFPKLKFGREGANGEGTGGKYGQALFNSLSDADLKRFSKHLQDFFVADGKTRQVMAELNEAQITERISKADELELTKEDAQLTMPLHPTAEGLLKAGDLKGALSFIAGQDLGRVSAVANKLLSAIGSTKVEVVKGLKNADGKPVAGLFDPKTNTIKLDAEAGMHSHAVLHEAVHAATAHVLSNKSHPVTRQLTELYNNVKDSLDTAYGAQSLDEFVAEAFSNPEFQEKLNAINPKGEPITAWQRFRSTIANFVRRMLGMDTKPVGSSAMDATDRLVNSILSPAPQYRNAGSLYSASLLGKAGNIFDNIANQSQSLPGMNEERVSAFHEFFTGTIPKTAKKAVRAALPLNALVEVAQKYIPMAPQLDVLIGQRSGAENRRNQLIEPIVKRVENWAAANPKLVDALNRTVYGSTVNQVDPSKPRSTYVGKMDESGNKLDAAWDSLQADWKALGTDGQSVYKHMRDTYKSMHEEVKRVLGGRIDEALDDPKTAKKVKEEIYKKLFESGNLEPYFPLTRTGKYWLSYNQGGEFYVEAYETNLQRDNAIKALGNNATDVQKFANMREVNYRKAPPTSFVNSVLRTLETNKVDVGVTEEVMQLFLNTLPETSFAQAFRHRKGTAGYDTDALRALRTKAFSMSRQLANMEYGAKLEKLRADMRQYVRSQNNPETAVEFMDELDARLDYAISPNVPTWSKLATSFGFNMTLGFNVSSALVNLAQVPLVTMPYLGGKYGFSESAKAIGRASRIFASSGFSRESKMMVPTDTGQKSMMVRAFPSIDNYDFTNPKFKHLAHLQTLVRVAQDRGQLNRSQIHDVLDVGHDNTLLTKVNAMSGFTFHHGERMNRQVALIAAYELELAHLKKQGVTGAKAEEQAAQQAVYITELTNGGTAAAAAPRLSQGKSGIGKVMFMYKRYGVSMYYMLFKTTHDMLKGETPEVRKAAAKQIAGIYASSALMAGVQGIPMFGIAAMLYNMFKDKDDDTFENAARKWMGELKYSGGANALLGTEIAGRIGLSDLLYRDNNTKDQQSMVLNALEALGGPVLGMVSRVERGLTLINDGHAERGIEQMLPSALGNVMKAFRFSTEGANTLRGDPITGEIGPWNTFAQALGFAPAEYIRQLEINSAEKHIERVVMKQRSDITAKFYTAVRMGDASGMNDALDKLMKFNAKHPTAAITADDVMTSMEQHMKTSAEMYHGVTLNKKLRPELMANIAEYDAE